VNDRDPGGTPIVIAIALDRGYAPWAATLVRSCVRANPSSKICFEIVHDGTLSDEDCGRLAETATSNHSSVRFHAVAGDDLSHLPTTPLFGSIVWLRFRLPDLLLDRSRVLYLDSDTLVMADLHGLWDTPLDPHPLAAVANVVEPAARPHVQALGIQYPGGFFNSGVLLMDLDRMRAEHSSDQLFKAAADLRESLVWPDQDALNLVFANRWLPLHPRWNTQNSFWAWRQWAVEVFGEALLEDATRQPAIRHFEGPGLSKPWHYLCPYPGRKQYRALLAETPWAHIPLEDRTAATWFVKLFPREMRYRAYARLLQARRRSIRSVQC
jgi:lipopolysaccharide biosynthesis glycosyltransferase